MSDKRQEFELRARQCMEQLKGVMTEAKNAGFAVEVHASMDVSGEPQVAVAVLMR